MAGHLPPPFGLVLHSEKDDLAANAPDHRRVKAQRDLDLHRADLPGAQADIHEIGVRFCYETLVSENFGDLCCGHLALLSVNLEKEVQVSQLVYHSVTPFEVINLPIHRAVSDHPPQFFVLNLAVKGMICSAPGGDSVAAAVGAYLAGYLVFLVRSLRLVFVGEAVHFPAIYYSPYFPA